MAAHWIENPDTGVVTEAADLLDTSEFGLFSLAYERWHGRSPEPRVIEKHFAAYMFRSVVPPWVRHLAREIVAKASEGTLRGSDYGIQATPLSPDLVRRGRIHGAVLLAVCILLLLASWYYDDLVRWVGNCYFPPCY